MRQRETSRRSMLMSELGPLVILLAVVGYLAPVLFAGDTLFFRDLYSYFIPQKQMLVELVRAHGLPLINPLLHGGQPFLASLANAALYPGNLLLVALPAVFAVNLLVALHLLLGGVATYVLARELDLRPPAACTAGLSFSFCGLTLSQINLLNLFLASSWLPVQLLLWRDVLRRRRPRHFVLLVVVSAAQLLAGAPEISVLSFLLLLVWAVTEQPGWAALRLWSNTLLLVVALGAVQLLPTAELVAASSRSGGMSQEAAATWSLAPVRLGELVAPGFCGPVGTLDDSEYWGRSRVDGGFPYLLSLYFGWFVVGLAALGSGFRPPSSAARGWPQILAVVAVSGLVLALGDHLPGYGLVAQCVPGASLFRFPSKLALVAALPVALLAACGVERLCRENPRRDLSHRWRGVAVAAVLAAAAGLTVAWWSTLGTAVFERIFAQPGRAALVAGFRHSLVVSSLLLLATLCLLGLWRLVWRPWLPWLCAALVGGDLLLAARGLNPVAKPELLFSDPPAAQAVKQVVGGGRLFSAEAPPRSVIRAPSNRALWRYRYMAELLEDELGAGFDIPVILHEDLVRMAPRPLMELRELVLALSWQQRVSLLEPAGVTAVLSSEPIEDERLVPVVAIPNRGPAPRYLYRLEGSAPSCRVLAHVRWVRSEEEVKALLRRPDYDAAMAVVLRAEGGNDGSEHRAPHGGVRQERRLNILHETPSRLTVELGVEHDVLLATSRSWAPGWRALVDGEQVPLLRSDLAFMAVEVPPGVHRVELAYRPLTMVLGAGISALAAALLVGLSVRFSRRAPAAPGAG